MDIKAIKDRIVNIIKNPYFYSSIFALMLFIKCVLFNLYAFDTLIISSLWKAPTAFWGYYLPKIAISIGVAAFVLLCNRKRVAIVISALVDIWIIVNLMYVRSYGMVVDAFSITMVGNLRGFESSLPLYLRWFDIAYPLLTILLILLPYGAHSGKRRSVYSFCCVAFALALGYMGQYLYLRNVRSTTKEICEAYRWRLFTMEARRQIYGIELTSPTKQTSILHLVGYDIYDLIVHINEKCHPYQLSSEEKLQISQFYISDAHEERMSLPGPLVIVIVESFENWVFQPEVMPNLTAFCQSHPVFYADKVKSQVRGGMSADGQMMINTGLLPTLEGAACYRFPGNTYPGIMKLVEGKSVSLVPHNVDVWNQRYMSTAYGYDTTAQVSPVDTILFRQVLDYLHEGYRNVQVLTMSSHSPFTSGAALSNLSVSGSYGELERNYIKAFNTLDHGLSILLEAIDTDSILNNSMVVITGDHNVLTENATCPLIIYSPSINTTVTYTADCYQMDIYPTLIDVLGLNPCWRGFGISLLSEEEYKITENPALDLSDKMLRSNYFALEDDNSSISE